VFGGGGPVNRARFEVRPLLKRALSSTAVLPALLMAFLAIGCDSNESGVRIWCEGVCAAVARCGHGSTDCATNCVRGEPGLAHLSSSGASALKPCLEQLSCLATSGDDSAWKNEQTACWDSARMSVAIADHARRLCSTYALAWFDCGYSLSVDYCGRIYSMWDDAVLDRIALCESAPTCEELQSCEQSAYEDH
jgi:hypothetical protein